MADATEITAAETAAPQPVDSEQQSNGRKPGGKLSAGEEIGKLRREKRELLSEVHALGTENASLKTEIGKLRDQLRARQQAPPLTPDAEALERARDQREATRVRALEHLGR